MGVSMRKCLLGFHPASFVIKEYKIPIVKSAKKDPFYKILGNKALCAMNNIPLC